MAANYRILIVEDDRSITNMIQTVLETNNYIVLCTDNGTEACFIAENHCPDLILLDLGLPDVDGTELIKRIRQWSAMPIIVVSARTHESDKVAALDMGADDYITKPFGTGELLARIRTALRHGGTFSSQNDIKQTGKYTVGGLVIDYDRFRVYIDGTDAKFTQNEFKLIAFLGRYAGKVMTYDTIIRAIWGPNANADNQILRVNMANIRRKIEKCPAHPEYIFTEVGIGYRLADEESFRENNRQQPR